jgi:putative transposase
MRADVESSYLALDPDCDEDALPDLQGHSISYRIALGSRRGQKAFTLQTLSPRGEERVGVAQANGFSLHAGVAAEACERSKLERLRRYVSRPPVSSESLALTASGQVRYTLKTPYRDGTTHIVLEPLDLMARLAALVPRPRMHLTRYHGVLAPHSQYRAAVMPAHRGRGAPKPSGVGR